MGVGGSKQISRRLGLRGARQELKAKPFDSYSFRAFLSRTRKGIILQYQRCTSCCFSLWHPPARAGPAKVMQGVDYKFENV